MTEIFSPGEGVGDEEIEALAQKLAVTIPEELRTFLKQNNGGRPDPDSFEVFDGEDVSSVDMIYGVGGPYHRNIEKIFETFKDRIPEGFLPIAADAVGNQILIGIGDEFAGQVFFWDRDGEADDSLGEIPTMDNMDKIAPSFSEFIDKLFEFDDEDDDLDD